MLILHPKYNTCAAVFSLLQPLYNDPAGNTMTMLSESCICISNVLSFASYLEDFAFLVIPLPSHLCQKAKPFVFYGYFNSLQRLLRAARFCEHSCSGLCGSAPFEDTYMNPLDIQLTALHHLHIMHNRSVQSCRREPFQSPTRTSPDAALHAEAYFCLMANQYLCLVFGFGFCPLAVTYSRFHHSGSFA